jgi:hypothetical protein
MGSNIFTLQGSMNKKAPLPGAKVLFSRHTRKPVSQRSLFALSALMSRACKELAVFVLSHLFPALFNNTAQWITSFLKM